MRDIVGLISVAPSGIAAHIAGWRLRLIRPTPTSSPDEMHQHPLRGTPLVRAAHIAFFFDMNANFLAGGQVFRHLNDQTGGQGSGFGA